MSSTQAFSDWIEATTGARLLSRSAVGGGCIHSAWRLTLANGQTLFAKTNRAELLPVLEAEAQGLEALAQAVELGASGLTVPQPCGLGLAGPEAVLLPVVPGLLELLGLVVVGQWSWKNLTTSDKRTAVINKVQGLRKEYLG